MRLQILILTAVIIAGVAICIYVYRRNGDGSVINDGEIKGWTWDGELVRDAMKEGKGFWKPFYK